jgi:predicted nucleic acid-binding protein
VSRLVLDADVLIGALDSSDPHHTEARALFSGWHQERTTRWVSMVNLSEVLVAPSADKERLQNAREAIGALGVAIHQPDEAIAVEAASLRHTHPLSLPDAYCLATAHRIGAGVVSFDQKVLRAAKSEGIALIR